MKMRIKIIFCVAFLICVTMMSCSKEKEPIRIGFVANLTKQTTNLATGARNGVLLALDNINEKGGINGHPIKLIVKDDQFDPEVAKKVDQELIDEGVVAIVGHIYSNMSLAALPVINKAKVVMISPVAASSKLNGMDDYFFKINPSTVDTSALTAQYAYDKGLRTVACLYDLASREYAEEKYAEFKKAFESLGGHVPAANSFVSSDRDVSIPDLVKGIPETDPDGYYLIVGPRDTALICQHLRKIDPERPILSSPWAYDQELLQNGGKAVEGLVLSHSFKRSNHKPDFVSFKQRYYQRYQKMPGIWEAYGYEAMMVLAQALQKNSNPEELKQTIRKIKQFKGLQGNITFDQYGENRRKPRLFKVKDGAFVEIH